MSTPEGWVDVRLDEVAEVRLGRQRSPDKAHGDNLVPYLRAANVRWSGLDLSDVKTMQFSPEEVRTFQLRRGDILVVEASGSQGEVGKVALWNEELPLACLQNTLLRIRSRGADPSFLRWRLHFDAVIGGLGGASKGIGIYHIGAERLSSWQVGIPPLREQRRIAAKLDAVFAQTRVAKARLERLPSLLDRLKRSVLAAAFRGDLTAGWRAAHPDAEFAIVLLDRIRADRRRSREAGLREKGKDPSKATYDEPASVDTDALPPLPTSWVWVRLPEFGEIARGRSRHRPRNEPALFGDRVPFIQTGEVSRSGGRITNWTTMYSDFGVAQSRVFPAGTVCITIAANIAESGVLCFDACFPDSVVGVSVDVRLAPPAFVEFFNRVARENLARFAPATAQANINLEILGDVAVPLPPRRETEEIVRILTETDAVVEQITKRAAHALERLVRMEQAALAKAFRGELVPQDPTDEPVSVLLDRIRAARAAEPDRPSRGRGRRADDNTMADAKSSNGHATNGRRDESVDLVVGVFQIDQRLTVLAITDATGLAPTAVKKALKILVDGGQVRVDGKAQSAAYIWTA